jgi:pimeloyl-ACP methyl ester carboxylesterase
MPTVNANGIAIYYETHGEGEPLILIPYLAADQGCYAFQVAEYAKHFQCITVDNRGAGQSDKPDGTYSTELFADDVASFMQALGIERAHVSGLSLGAAVGMWLAAKYPAKVKTLSLHSAWSRTTPYVTTVVEAWRVLARAYDSVPEMIVNGIFPWCFTPDFYSANPDYIGSLAAFVRGRPVQPVHAFLQQAHAVQTHDVDDQLARIDCPTLITFGCQDAVTPPSFAQSIGARIAGSELVPFEDCSHAALYQNVQAFNERTRAFLSSHSG